MMFDKWKKSSVLLEKYVWNVLMKNEIGDD